MSSDHRSGVIASIQDAELAYDVLVDVGLVQDLGGRASTSMSRTAGGNVAQRGAEERPGPLAHREAFGEFLFCVLRHPPPGLVRGKERDRVLAYGSAGLNRRHVLLTTPRREWHGGRCPLTSKLGAALLVGRVEACQGGVGPGGAGATGC